MMQAVSLIIVGYKGSVTVPAAASLEVRAWLKAPLSSSTAEIDDQILGQIRRYILQREDVVVGQEW